ncbi:MAG: hypothetical protein L0211_16835 [Planctomycetaceae bacterium]|nr:hypothetical protein [Planctomycetaceae bacterium]
MRQVNPLQRQAIRAALSIHDHLAGTGRMNGLVKLPSPLWEDTQAVVSRLEFSLARGWRAASDSLLADLDGSLRRLRSELDTCHANLPRATVASKLAPPGETVADILALDDEFDGLTIDLQEKLIQVQTDPIVLEDTALGSFRIVLRWEQIGRHRAYEVVADTPCCPEHDDDVTHPHVREQLLCEGEGAAAIRRALAEGRLLDFFTIVRQVLETYNAGSAYVQLDRWNGVACRDCGYHMPDNDYGTCDRCEDPLCSECSLGCQKCDRYICSACSTTCEKCDCCLCECCVQVVADTGRLLCPTCFDQALEEENHDDACSEEVSPPGPAACPAPAGAAAATDPLCLVEAPVPA